jgi:SAM-dependent methyltransferase
LIGHDPHSEFPAGFFDRSDGGSDSHFYAFERLVTHIDARAIEAVGTLYERLGLHDGLVLDLMSSWISHFRVPPAELVVLGMNAAELAANPMATERVVHDLNESAAMPFFTADRFDAATCCVSIDYLIRPIDVIRELARVVKPAGVFVCTFSNRCFPSKAIRGWLSTNDEQHCAIVARYFAHAGGWEPAEIARCTPPNTPGDPLYAVWARRTAIAHPADAP